MELEFLSLDDDSTETAEIRQLLLCPNNKIVVSFLFISFGRYSAGYLRTAEVKMYILLMI